MSEPRDLERVPEGLLSRLALVPAKLRARGVAWLLGRLTEEGSKLRAKGRTGITRGWATLIRVLFFLAPRMRRLGNETLFALYDLDVYPISYDICWFLVWADLERRRRHRKRLHCVFIPISDETLRKFPEGYDAVVDSQSRNWRFHNICVGMTVLLPSGGNMTVCASREHADALLVLLSKPFPKVSVFAGGPPTLAKIYRETCAGLHAEGAEWNGLAATVQGRRYVDGWLAHAAGTRRPVVITLRQYGVDPERNSCPAEWAAFAQGLDREAYQPIIVSDTDSSLAPMPEFEGIPVFQPAAWNLGLRMALYEAAYLNMFVNSGPGSLCILNRSCRYLFFKVTVPSTHLASEATLLQMGFARGTSPDFATPFQKWVWEPDHRETLRREFDAMVARIEGGAEIEHAPVEALGA